MDPNYPKVHLIEHLIEECTELIQALQKTKRFGWDNYKPGNTRSYRLLIIMEIRNVKDSLEELKKYMEQQPCTNILSSLNILNKELTP